MTNVKNLKSCLFVLLALIFSSVIVSCGDDDSAPNIISAKDVEGNYTGKMQMVASTPDSYEGDVQEPVLVDVSAVINDKEVVFEKFPVASIIEAIVGAESAPGIIESVGDVAYQLPYTGALKSEYTEIELTFTPKPLELEITLPATPAADGEEGTPKKVVVTLSTPEKGLFVYKDNKLTLGLSVDKVIVDDAEIPFTTLLNFNLNKVK